MEALFHNLGIGFAVALTFQNLFYCLMGCLLGTLIGVLPASARWPLSPCCCRSLLRSTRLPR